MKIFLLICFLELSVSFLFADNVQLNIQINPETIGINEQAVIIIEVEQKPLSINAPQNSNFDLVYSGESASSQVSIVNGKMTSKTTYSYSFILTPKKRGIFEIGAFEIKVNNQIYSTSPQKINVVKESQNKQNNVQQDPFAQLEEFFNKRPKIPSIYLKLIANPNSVYQNQQVVLNAYVISSDKDIFNYKFSEASPIRSDRSAIYDITPTSDSGVIKSGIYYQKLIKRYAFYPIEPGKIGIAPPVFIAISPFGQIQLKSENIGVDSFKVSGISYIGDLSISMNSPPGQADEGKSIDISIEMTGDGNLKILSNPYSDLKIDGIYLSSPVTQLKFIGIRNGKAYFNQSIKYSLLAQKPGVYSIPPVIINYYDNFLIKREIRLKEFSIKIRDKEPIVKRENFKLKKIDKINDFHFILSSPVSISVISFFIILPLFAFLFGRHKDKMENDNIYSRKFLANKRLSKYLSEAKIRLDERKYPEFFTALQKGIFYYITDKLNIPSGISFKELLKTMQEKKVREDLIKIFFDVYNACNKNAYSAIGSIVDDNINNEEKAEKLLKNVYLLINHIK